MGKKYKAEFMPILKEEPEGSGSMEIIMLDGSLPWMANILFFQPEVVNGWMEVPEAGKKMVSWNNYCPPPKNIIQEYRLLGIYFSWKPGDQELNNMGQKYWPFGIYFPWDPGRQELHA